MWSFVNGTGMYAPVPEGGARCCPCCCGRVRATTARLSPTHPVVTTRPLSVFCRTVRMAVEPEKRQSLTFCAIVPDVRAKPKLTASVAALPACEERIAPEEK